MNSKTLRPGVSPDIEINVAARTAATECVELINGELKKLVDKHGSKAIAPFFGVLCDAYPRLKHPPALEPERPAPKRQMQIQGDPVDEALDDIQEALSLIEDLPERAQEFGENAESMLTGIAENIEQYQRVTPKQRSTIDNITSGLKKWTH